MAKSRVALVKRVMISLPGLELLAAYITAKLLHYVIQALQIVVDAVYGWSDSQITLAWITRPSAHWKAFVANRVQDIHQWVAPSQWSFCSGSQNQPTLSQGESLHLRLETATCGGKVHIGYNSHAVTGLLMKCRKQFQRSVLLKQGTNLLREWHCLSSNSSKKHSRIGIKIWNLATLRTSNRMDPKVVTSTWRAEEREAVRRGIKGIWIYVAEKLCDTGQMHQKSCIVKLNPHFDQTKKPLVVPQIPEEAKHQIIMPHNEPVIEKLIIHLHVKACHAGPETTLAILRQRFWLTQGGRKVKLFWENVWPVNVG